MIAGNEKLSPLTNVRWNISSINIMNLVEIHSRGRMLRAKERKMKHHYHADIAIIKKFLSYIHISERIFSFPRYIWCTCVNSCIFPNDLHQSRRSEEEIVYTYVLEMMCTRCKIIILLRILFSYVFVSNILKWTNRKCKRYGKQFNVGLLLHAFIR